MLLTPLEEVQVFRGFGSAVILLLRRSLNQRPQGRRGMEVIRKVANELLHGRMPEAVETEEIHLIHSLLRRPFVDGHTIRSNENAGAVVSEAAMHKDFLVPIVAEQR